MIWLPTRRKLIRGAASAGLVAAASPLFIRPALAAVTVNATSASPFSRSSNAGTFSYTDLTIAAGSNIALIVQVGLQSAGTLTTCTWNGVNVPLLGNGPALMSLYGLLNPSTGTGPLAVTWAGGFMAISAAAFNGVGSFANFTSNNTTSAGPATLTVPGGTATSMAVDVTGSNSQDQVSSSGQTFMFHNNSAAPNASGSYGPATAGSTAFSWNMSASAYWEDVGVNLLAPSVGSPQRTLTGVGT